MSQQLVALSNGERVPSGVYFAFLQLQAAVKAALGITLWISSGFRTAAEQERIFRSRYTTAPGGRKVYDTRVWKGVRWYRISPDGTVAVPGTSMHERASAVDFGGIPARGGTPLANWLRANAARYGFSPTGYGFGEAWHYDYTRDPWAGGAPAGGGNSVPATVPSPANTESEYPEMFIAVVNGSWFLVVPQGTSKPRAVVLGGESQASKTGLPTLYFTWAPAIAQLKAAVSGIA